MLNEHIYINEWKAGYIGKAKERRWRSEEASVRNERKNAHGQFNLTPRSLLLYSMTIRGILERH